MLVIIALIILGLVAAGVYSRTPKPAQFTDKDTLVLADFVNFTGEAVVDGSLDTALSISLQQSPFLDLLSKEKVQATLKLMKQPMIPIYQQAQAEYAKPR